MSFFSQHLFSAQEEELGEKEHDGFRTVPLQRPEWFSIVRLQLDTWIVCSAKGEATIHLWRWKVERQVWIHKKGVYMVPHWARGRLERCRAGRLCGVVLAYILFVWGFGRMCHACLLAWIYFSWIYRAEKLQAEAKGEVSAHPVPALTYRRHTSRLDTTEETLLGSSV